MAHFTRMITGWENLDWGSAGDWKESSTAGSELARKSRENGTV